MTANAGATFIVGGDSTVGLALRGYCARAGHAHYWTSRRPSETPEPNCVRLDLASADDDGPVPEGITSAVLCAAVTRIDACRLDPETTARINVDGAVRVARQLVERGVFTVFLSTNQVFDGERAFPGPEDPTTPRSAYGRQKAEAERRLLDLGPLVAIVRCTKILGAGFPLFRQWQTSLRNRQPIEPFFDVVMAPVPLSYVVAFIRLLTDRRSGGIYQVSGNRDLTYAEVARRAAEQLGAAPHLVQPISASLSGRIAEPIPANTALNVEKVRRLWGVDAPPVEWTINQALAAA